MDKRDKSEESTDLTFEQALQRLETSVAQLEDGKIGLHDALQQYEKGVKYLKHCHRLLENAERRVKLLRGIAEDGTAEVDSLDEGDL